MKKKNQKEIFLGQFLSVLSLSDNRLCLKFVYDMTQQIITAYFYGSVCVSHTLLLYDCACVCVCVCACVRDKRNIYTQCHISVVVKTHELPVLSKYRLVL